jgi:hypothetical protein
LCDPHSRGVMGGRVTISRRDGQPFLVLFALHQNALLLVGPQHEMGPPLSR